jgi:hypothetical protein
MQTTQFQALYQSNKLSEYFPNLVRLPLKKDDNVFSVLFYSGRNTSHSEIFFYYTVIIPAAPQKTVGTTRIKSWNCCVAVWRNPVDFTTEPPHPLPHPSLSHCIPPTEPPLPTMLSSQRYDLIFVQFFRNVTI